ncbi:TetR/AcrR family transcriptional regulator [Niveispirillum sp. BGYR6]|uniref:TetR/AcrR family transcriptional regulator n=1 Tax=Niveispirillum sp. BGYR6 TaxID=2971249 RepID=UPI0022B9C88B|nr:TetR/AcrR family transcriptional regulator [Niveispirillum sp. BGYR6]MDG5497522.1 TetR/AcrR family transcriptional regulator [Niveispirillum sp. BGYR6]
MRVSRTQATENREHVITVASRLFREHGFDGIGLKDLMEGAGLTQGAFYKQFSSKEDLAAQASRRAFENVFQRWTKAAEQNPADPLAAMLTLYLSPEHRDEWQLGCPIVALGADAARQGDGVKASFEDGIRSQLDLLEAWLGDPQDDKTRKQAMTTLATMVGAVLLARSVNDDDLSRQFLGAAADAVRAESNGTNSQDS